LTGAKFETLVSDNAKGFNELKESFTTLKESFTALSNNLQTSMNTLQVNTASSISVLTSTVSKLDLSVSTLKADVDKLTSRVDNIATVIEKHEAGLNNAIQLGIEANARIDVLLAKNNWHITAEEQKAEEQKIVKNMVGLKAN